MKPCICEITHMRPCIILFYSYFSITYYETLYYSVFYSNFSKILVPLQSAMTVTLPNTPGSHPDHNPFPCNEIYIEVLEDMVCILYR